MAFIAEVKYVLVHTSDSPALPDCYQRSVFSIFDVRIPFEYGLCGSCSHLGEAPFDKSNTTTRVCNNPAVLNALQVSPSR